MNVVKAEFVEVIESEAARVYTFRASTGAVDRQNEIVDQMGWDLEPYRSNPVILDSHKYESIEDIIGRAVRVEVMGGVLEADIIFADSEKGECAEQLVNQGFLRTVSVGFRSLERRPGGAGQPLTHTRAELLEISLVAVPANREAVRVRGVDLEDIITETKAGRVISAGNLEKLQSAIDSIQSVIDAAMGGEPVQKEPMAEACEPEEYRVNAGVVDALTRFVGGHNG